MIEEFLGDIGIYQTGQSIGMQTLDQCLVDLVRRNVISAAEARTRAVNKELFGAA